MDKYTVSIILSTYNSAKTLNRALSSVYHQTYTNWKLICIDDASTDDTANILKSWQQKLSDQMQIISNPKNLGLTKSLNLGISAAKTEFIARLDADDWWELDKLKKQINHLNQNPEIGLLGCNYTNHYDLIEKDISLPLTDQTIKQTIFRKNPFGHSCVIFKKSLWQQVGGYDESIRYGQDLDLWFRFLPLAKFHNLPESLCHREISKQPHKQQQTINHLKTTHKYIKKYHAPFDNYLYLAEPIAVGLWHKMK